MENRPVLPALCYDAPYVPERATALLLHDPSVSTSQIEDTGAALERRLPPDFLRRRLALEQGHDSAVFAPFHRFFHVDGPVSLHACVRLALRCALLYGRGRRNAAQVVLRENEVRFPNLPAAFDGFTLLQITDLHADGNPAAMDALERLLPGLAYDHCVLTGDYRSLSFGDYGAVLTRMASIAAKLKPPIHGVMGNHDTIRMLPALEAMGIAMLMNESIAIERNGQRIHLAGIDDAHYFGTHDLAAARAAIPAGAFSILLSHTPEAYAGIAAAGFDYVLCGHTHGGQICLPGGIPVVLQAPRLPRRYGSGLWRHGRLTGFTSRGAGTSMVHVRFNCPGEVVLHRLRRG
jgi:predicted MPP superfamily phosphohydrolase